MATIGGAMKKNLIGSLLFALVVMLMHDGCVNPKSALPADSGNDTLIATVVRHGTTHYSRNLYRLISQKAGTTFDTIYSNTVPPTTTPITFGSNGNCGDLVLPTFRSIISLRIDTLYRFIDNPASQDTIFIWDSLDSSHVDYLDTINCRIDTVEACRKNHKPYFAGKDSIAIVLSNPMEGYTQYILLQAFHFDNDSSTIKLIDNPSWAQLIFLSVSERYGDCWFYPRCVNGELAFSVCIHVIAKRAEQPNFISDCVVPYMVFKADSTALDSTYHWKVVITNKYAQSDTINISSTVTPFPYSRNCQ